ASVPRLMSMKSPVSSICLVAWAKRLSSRSSGGSVKKPGSQARTQRSSSTAKGRRWTVLGRLLCMPSLGRELKSSVSLFPAPMRLYKARAQRGKVSEDNERDDVFFGGRAGQG